jgi:hypothetical protein
MRYLLLIHRYNRAIDAARRIPAAVHGAIEVRPIVEFA